MKDFTKGFNRKLVGLGSFARLGNLSLEANSLRLRRFNQDFNGKSEGLGSLSRLKKSGQGILCCSCLRIPQC